MAQTLTIDLPGAVRGARGEQAADVDSLLELMFDAKPRGAGFVCPDVPLELSVDFSSAATMRVGLGARDRSGGDAARRTAGSLEVPAPRTSTAVEGDLRSAASTSYAQPVEIIPGLALEPLSPASIERFLRESLVGIDHLGVNLSHQAVQQSDWERFKHTLAQQFPVYRLDLPSPNDILILIVENARPTQLTAVELVYDRSASFSSFHVCVNTNATQVQIDRQFAAPHGAYKPGDEAFFRSTPLPLGLAIPSYLDMTFADHPLPPWKEIVKMMGRRLN